MLGAARRNGHPVSRKGSSLDDDLTVFLKAEYPKLVGILGLYCNSRAVAEDLAQESLARAWRHWKKVRRLDDPAGWLRKVALNLARSHWRRVMTERRVRQQAVRSDHYLDPDTADKEAVRAAVAALPSRQRTALILRYYLDLPFGQVAAEMDVPEATAKSLVRRAIQRLRNEHSLIQGMEVLDVR